MLQTQPFSAEQLSAANINATSFLATDYLNHFNEVVMLIEMVPDMPDMIEDILCWEPCSYADHFRQSVFADKDLAIAAYEAAPTAVRKGFEAVVADLNREIEDVQITLSGVDQSAPMDPALADQVMMAIVQNVRPAIDRASGIINAVDKCLDGPVQADGDDATVRAQDAVDELFD
ncbi:MAG: hypothetical protein AAGH43_04560 [Pseudomonadota bacterium]